MICMIKTNVEIVTFVIFTLEEIGKFRQVGGGKFFATHGLWTISKVSSEKEKR